MPSPLIRTKLHRPQSRPDLVRRPRLLDQLEGTALTRLTLISAPPGFGKTTLLTSWLEASAASRRPVAWVSLEQTERQPKVFWAYVMTALDAVAPGTGAAALAMLGASGPSMRATLTSALNELDALPGGLDLVLDDYHLADGPAITDDVAFLLEHLPPLVRLVISTRADPALPLARLRARGELVELRAADLRFSGEETATYLNEAAGLHLEPPDIAALEGRTEGWIAALQLAALSLKGRADVTAFIDGFAGEDRYVVDYLVEEVLSRQPDAVGRFLLQTSILDRLTGPLCDAVTGSPGGKATLELLDRSNLFIVPLDDSRHWYRYHHLFADVLRAHLADQIPEDVASLHSRASAWYDAAGEPVAAVRHALAGGDVARAAELMELALPALHRDRQEATIRQWLDEIPPEVVKSRPVLAVGFIGALMAGGEFDTVESRVDDVERLLQSADGEEPADIVVTDRPELARMPGAIAMYRAGLALVHGDLAGTVGHAQRAIARAADGDDLVVSAAGALSGLAQWSGGDLVGAHRDYTTALQGLRRAGHQSDVLGCSIAVADLEITQGRLRDARRTYEDGIQLAALDAPSVMRGTPDMLVGLTQLAVERDDLEAATDYLDQVEEMGEQSGLPQHPYRWRVARARRCEAAGDLDEAIALLEQAERVYVGDFSPNVRPLPAMRARLLVACGRLAEALIWARDADVSADDELSYVREYEHLTLARLLLGRHLAERSASAPTRAPAGDGPSPSTAAGLSTASQLLERLETAAEAGGRTGTLIEILVLEALVRHAAKSRRDPRDALEPLERALRLAEPEGYVRVFVGEGPVIVTLLQQLAKEQPSWSYLDRLLEASDPARRATPYRTMASELVDHLSPRELDVLRLLASELDGPAIARELVVSLNTVRTHTKSIYAKLNVNSRRGAVSRAGQLHLLGTSVR